MLAPLLLAPGQVAARVMRNRRLAYELTKRELLDRYSGQILGVAWAIIQPAAMIAVFILVFGVVFKMRITTNGAVQDDFVAYLVAGLIPWMVVQEVLSRGPGLVLSQAHLVRQVVFPLEVLAVRVTIPAFVPLLVGFTLLLVKQFYEHGSAPLTWLCVPFLMILLTFSCIGFGLLLGALGVFLRDLKDIVQFFIFVALYLSPIFYTLEAAPGPMRLAMNFNPFTPMILSFQDAIFYGSFVHPWAWIANAVISIAAYVAGSRVFTATQHYFGSYL